MRQFDSVRMLLEKKERRDAASANAERHGGNLLDLQCDSDSDMEENDLLSTFEYQVLSMENPVLAATQDSQERRGRGRPPNAILDRKTKVTKKQVQKERELPTPKTLRSGE